MKKDRIAITIVSILCVALATSLVGAVIYYSGVIGGKDTQINEQEISIAEQNDIINSLKDDNTDVKNINSQLNQTNQILQQSITDLQSERDGLKAIIHGIEPSELKTVVWHISEKGEETDWGHTPDVQSTYQEILNRSAPYDVLLLPEYKGNLNWTETFGWLSSNFTGIPIVLSVFEGGYDKLPDPNAQLTVSEIQQAMSKCDVKMIRFSEIISWYMGQNQTFPIDYVRNMLSFARQHNMKVLWSEWKIGDDVIQPLRSYIAGYENTVTVLAQTNSEFNEPLEAFQMVSQFQHWGASIQNWYWVENRGYDEMDMPTSLIIRHLQTATSMGAEVLQFESSRYFFDNGEPRDIVTGVWLAIK